MTSGAVTADLRRGGGGVRVVAFALLVIGAAGCATSAPPDAAPGASPAPAAEGASQPPPFSETPSPDPRAEIRRRIVDEMWKLIRDNHYDKTFGGLDWGAVRARHEPLALAAPTEAAFYRALNDMLGELRQSHTMVSGPGAEVDETDVEAEAAQAEKTASSTEPTGEPGLTVRLIEGRPMVTSVRKGSSAERAGIRAGFVVTHVGGRPLSPQPRSQRPLRPVEERYLVRLTATRRLAGPAGSKITVRVIDLDDRPGELMLERDPPRGKPVQIGWLPTLYPELRVSQVGNVGVIAFNLFLFQPVLVEIQAALDGFRARGVKAIVFDVRGNPGGQGVMAIPIAARLVSAPLELGTMQYRDFSHTLTARPSLGVVPFTGPVAVLTDEGSASTAEIFAAGLQEARRAVVVGDATPGYALPSAVKELPGGAVIQYVVADFRTPSGQRLEGRGVQPDRPVRETRAALKAGRDPVLDAALEALKASRRP